MAKEMTETRTHLDQVIDGIFTASAWLVALMLPVILFQEPTCLNQGVPVIELGFAALLFVYIRRNLRTAVAGDRTKYGDLLARVIVPLLLFFAPFFFLF